MLARQTLKLILPHNLNNIDTRMRPTFTSRTASTPTSSPKTQTDKYVAVLADWAAMADWAVVASMTSLPACAAIETVAVMV